MRIGCVGAGRIGQAVARLAAGAGHEVMLSNSRGPDSLRALADAFGVATGTVDEAAAFGDVVLLAVPLHALHSLSPLPFAGRIVIDAINYYPQRDGAWPELEQHTATTSRLVQRHLAGARVVKAFNAILADDIVADARANGHPERRALPVASDDAFARDRVAGLLDTLGFDALDAGGLDESWRFERAMPAYCIPMSTGALRTALGAARRGVELPHGSWRRRR